jgi:arginine deiminase
LLQIFLIKGLMVDNKIKVSSEIGELKRLIIHSPDQGLGKVIPAKAQDWLFEDIVHLDTIRKKEYDFYVKILLYFLDPDKIKGKLKEIDSDDQRHFFKPGSDGFHASDHVIDLEILLIDILKETSTRDELVAAVCAVEGCTQTIMRELKNTPPAELARILISGSMANHSMIFAPVPNLIFTRDIGIVINDFILLNKPAKAARLRESLLAKYIFFNHPCFKKYQENILEITDSKYSFLNTEAENGERTTLECGDLMMVSHNHLIIGCSERTSFRGANEAIKLLFSKNAVQKITVIKIPNKRDFMHLDTVFTQVRKDMWVILGSLFSARHLEQDPEPLNFIQEKVVQEHPEIIQFNKNDIYNPLKFTYLEDLLRNVSEQDLKTTEKTTFVYSGNDIFPHDAREQWTDSCNLLAIREGVVIGYDRNDKTIEAFKEHGFQVVTAKVLIDQFESGELGPEQLKDTLILIPSAELSRARGGFHCMSFPILRSEL